jgi:hypothetical protein
MNTDVRERIERYIENTKLSPKITDGYCLYYSEVVAFYEEMGKDWFGAIGIIFSYGRAKGYRAAKAEARK